MSDSKMEVEEILWWRKLLREWLMTVLGPQTPSRQSCKVCGVKRMGFATGQIFVQIPAPLLIWWVTHGKDLVKGNDYIFLEYDEDYRLSSGGKNSSCIFRMVRTISRALLTCQGHSGPQVRKPCLRFGENIWRNLNSRNNIFYSFYWLSF